MSTVDELTAASVSVNPAEDGKSVVDEESEELSQSFAFKFMLLLLVCVPTAAAATASNGLELMLPSILGYIVLFVCF